jgi:hypothetical protein
MAGKRHKAQLVFVSVLMSNRGELSWNTSAFRSDEDTTRKLPCEKKYSQNNEIQVNRLWRRK